MIGSFPLAGSTAFFCGPGRPVMRLWKTCSPHVVRGGTLSHPVIIRLSAIDRPVAGLHRPEKSCGSNFSLGLIGGSFAGAGPSACPPQSVTFFDVDCDACAKLNAANSNKEAPTTMERTKQRRICKLLLLASGPLAGLFRYTASRPLYDRPVPPRLI